MQWLFIFLLRRRRRRRSPNTFAQMFILIQTY